jgi:hypothetical protein
VATLLHCQRETCPEPAGVAQTGAAKPIDHHDRPGVTDFRHWTSVCSLPSRDFNLAIGETFSGKAAGRFPFIRFDPPEPSERKKPPQPLRFT